MVKVIVTPLLFDNYAYLLVWDSEAAVVDPGEAFPILKILEDRGLKLTTILNTHYHNDHVGGNEELKQQTGCQVIGPDDTRVPGLDRAVGDGDSVTFGSSTVEVIATPGHTRSDVCYYMRPCVDDEHGAVWTGDTLFIGGCGRLYEGSPEHMWQSLLKLAALPPDTLVYPGHEYVIENFEFALTVDPENQTVRQRLSDIREIRKAGRPTVPSTIGEERLTNPFLRAASPEMGVAIGMPHASAVEVFTELRRRKNAF
jgi:hydroxyacylglutathione hydrolase